MSFSIATSPAGPAEVGVVAAPAVVAVEAPAAAPESGIIEAWPWSDDPIGAVVLKLSGWGLDGATGAGEA